MNNKTNLNKFQIIGLISLGVLFWFSWLVRQLVFVCGSIYLFNNIGDIVFSL